MSEKVLRFALAALPVICAFSAGQVQAKPVGELAGPRGFENTSDNVAGMRSQAEWSTGAAPSGAGSFAHAETAQADFTRLQGAGLLVSESMLGTMDERLGMDAEARLTDKRIWVRYGGGAEGGGGKKAAVGGFQNNGKRYRVGALQLGGDVYRTMTDRVGVFVGVGASAFGNDTRYEGWRFKRPEVSGLGFGLYYNHNNANGWYVDGALQISRLEGKFGQGYRLSVVQPYVGASSIARYRDAKSTGTAFALQGELGYRYALSSGRTLTPKLRLDHHSVRMKAARGDREMGRTTFDGLNKTGIYYGVRFAQDWDTGRGKLRAWVEPGVSHALGAKAKSKHTLDLTGGTFNYERNLNATRLGLAAGLEGNITRSQTLRLEGRLTKAAGKRNSTGGALMAGWDMRF